MKNIEKIFIFANVVGKLKYEIRFKGVNHIKGDAVASHTWRLVLMIMLVAEELKLKINILKTLKLAIIHDLPESITGDVSARHIHFNNLHSKKRIKESKAIKKLAKILPHDTSKEITSLWEEYFFQKTKEARFVYAMDKIEGLYTYLEKAEKIVNPVFTAKYADYGLEIFPKLKPIIRELKKMLKQRYEKENIPWKKKYDIS
jgi:putative hydrolases of HD superfamily